MGEEIIGAYAGEDFYYVDVSGALKSEGVRGPPETGRATWDRG